MFCSWSCCAGFFDYVAFPLYNKLRVVFGEAIKPHIARLRHNKRCWKSIEHQPNDVEPAPLSPTALRPSPSTSSEESALSPPQGRASATTATTAAATAAASDHQQEQQSGQSEEQGLGPRARFQHLASSMESVLSQRQVLGFGRSISGVLTGPGWRRSQLQSLSASYAEASDSTNSTAPERADDHRPTAVAMDVPPPPVPAPEPPPVFQSMPVPPPPLPPNPPPPVA